tara:strand:+ start:1421 stop:2440 length:1020 start_codon:yes stop_codon:yes gene_type:complete
MVLSRLFNNLGGHLGSASLRFAGSLARRTGKRGNPWRMLPLDPTRADTVLAAPHPDQLSHLEAVLFLASQPLPGRKLAQLVRLTDGTAARTLVRELNTHYEQRGRSFRVEEVAGGYQLRTQKIFAPWIRKMVSVPRETRMSGPAMETLAVVAYRQPVMRTEIEKVRGVQCGEILRQLMERGMVRISGRADELGRPFLYGTTRDFLEVFGLRSLDELPRASMLRTPGENSEHEPPIEEGKAVSVCDATDVSKQWDAAQASEEIPVATVEEDFEDDLEDDEDYEDDDYEDDDYEDDEESEEDDGFNDEEWEEVEDEEEDDDEEWDEDEDTWDDDEDWDEDD